MRYIKLLSQDNVMIYSVDKNTVTVHVPVQSMIVLMKIASCVMQLNRLHVNRVIHMLS